jgi:uncharacterized membrane protein YhaH (DUF805 family)
MGFGTAIATCFSKYVDFQGRARRSEYWWWFLFYVILLVVANIVDAFVDPGPPGMMFHYGYIYLLALLVMILPTLSVTVRRLHDTNRSGFWIFLGFIPIVGLIILIVWYCQKGTSGPNTYGPDPTT